LQFFVENSKEQGKKTRKRLKSGGMITGELIGRFYKLFIPGDLEECWQKGGFKRGGGTPGTDRAHP
jgi:hypothetical protein